MRKDRLELSSKDKIQLEKRGFVVKKSIGIFRVFSLLTSIPFLHAIYFFSVLFWSLILFLVLSTIPYIWTTISDNYNQLIFSSEHLFLRIWVLHIPFLVYLINYISDYIISERVFYGSNWGIPTKKYLKLSWFLNYKENTLKELIVHPIGWFNRNIWFKNETIIVYWFLFWIVWMALWILSIMLNYGVIWIYIELLLAFIIAIGIIWEVWRFMLNSLHPLFILWNLWEKIQSLTPKIEKKSEEIQRNFQKDMNFRVLSDGFDTLANTFSQIVALVIKLEKVEKRANKWNLFDSEKYINSLREDIVEPLKSLRSFLEKHKKELIQSQKDLQKVRVGWDPESSSGWQEQGELSSKRGESLIEELTENIEKLDTMIGKMG